MEEPESVPELNDSIPIRRTLDNMNDLLYGKEVAFFEKGRDYKPASHHHLFTMEEKKQMATYDALDYRLPNNQVRRNHVWTSAQRDYQKWIVFMLIGLIIGTVSFLLYQCIGFLDYERLYLKDYPLKFVACSTGYGIIAAAVVAFGSPVSKIDCCCLFVLSSPCILHRLPVEVVCPKSSAT